MRESDKTAVIFFGPPGSGKGIEADLLARTKGFIYFDTGRFIEKIVHNPKFKKNKIIQQARKLFDAGKLTTPSWVLKEILSKITKKISKADFSVVFSGSPRSAYEAFGDSKNKGLIDILEQEYGKKNIKIIFLKVKPETSIKRNSARLVCSLCATPVLSLEKLKYCPLCGAKLRKRIFDNPEAIKIRLNEFQNRTKPILKELKNRSYKIIEINAESLPFEVFRRIQKKLKLYD